MSPRHLTLLRDRRDFERDERWWQRFLLEITFALPARVPPRGNG